MKFKVRLFEHGVELAESHVRSVPEAIRWASSILTDKTERAYIGAFGQICATFSGGAWSQNILRR